MGAHLRVEPGDVGARIVPIQTHGRPAGRLDVDGRIGLAAAGRSPAHVQDRVAGLRLIARVLQKFEELLARHIVFAEREGLTETSAAALHCRSARSRCGDCPSRSRRPEYRPSRDNRGIPGTRDPFAPRQCPRGSGQTAAPPAKATARARWDNRTMVTPTSQGRIIEWPLRLALYVSRASDRCCRARPAPRSPLPLAPSTMSCSRHHGRIAPARRQLQLGAERRQIVIGRASCRRSAHRPA